VNNIPPNVKPNEKLHEPIPQYVGPNENYIIVPYFLYLTKLTKIVVFCFKPISLHETIQVVAFFFSLFMMFWASCSHDPSRFLHFLSLSLSLSLSLIDFEVFGNSWGVCFQ
jgi:hypothetical protein